MKTGPTYFKSCSRNQRYHTAPSLQLGAVAVCGARRSGREVQHPEEVAVAVA